jgi:CRP-like cAMP-binding protein
MLQLTRQVRQATAGDLNMDWLKPFTATRRVQAGEVLFHKGGVSNDMFVVVSGRFRLVEIDIEIAPSGVIGELGLVAPERSRTQSVECVDAGTLLQIGYSQVEQLFFQNPKFGFYFLRLITQRLFQNIGRLETELAQCRQARAA